MLHERGERQGLGGGLDIPGPALSVLVESRRAIPPSRNFHADGERAVIVAAGRQRGLPGGEQDGRW